MSEPCRRRAIWAAAAAVPAPVPPVVQSKYACPKCGKEYKRGMYFHFKNCKG